MACSWKEARDDAKSAGLPHVYHDCDTDRYGACMPGEQQGSFQSGAFVPHRCICMPASLTPEELEEKEKIFRKENPDW